MDAAASTYPSCTFIHDFPFVSTLCVLYDYLLLDRGRPKWGIVLGLTSDLCFWDELSPP